MKSKVLITGVAGLFGANFSKYLCNKGYEVIGIDNLSGGYKDFVDPRVKFFCWDLTQQHKVKKLFEEYNPDYIFHFAAYAAAGLSPFIRNFNYKNNIITSANLINEAIRHNAKKFIFTSSLETYGEQKPPFDEKYPLKPTTPYGIAKMAVELDLKSAYSTHGLDYATIRPHCVHGVYQNIWDRYRNVIGIFIRKALVGEDLVVYGDGTQIRAFSDIKYYMDPMEKLMFEQSGETFNIGADKPTSILDLAKTVQKIAYKHGYKTDITYAEPRKEVHTAYCDHTKAKQLLNFKDNTDLEELIHNMLIWAEKQPKRKVKKMNIELEKGLYTYWQ